MSGKILNFLVDTRLATLLSQEYNSSERALKELIDNAWDADADSVSINLPEPMTSTPIIVEDNGSGMTEEELRRHYLAIASDRRARSGELTPIFKRRVKGRKGIGKFAGLMVANEMTLETHARGKRCSFTLNVKDLQDSEDIEHFPLPLLIEECDPALKGTKITLNKLKQNLAYPTPLKMRQILIQEYGRTDSFSVSVNEKQLDVDDVSGSFSNHELSLPDVGSVNLRFSISDQKSGIREPGIVLKVDGKAVGKPGFWGLEESEEFPQKLKKKLFGEISVDGLRDHVTAGWDGIVENSELLHIVQNAIEPILKDAFQREYGTEVRLAQARLAKKINERLSNLPEYKREFADKAIKKILARYYGEPDSKAEPIVNVLLEALENADYRVLLEHINETELKDVVSIADALNQFGLAEMAIMMDQAHARMRILDHMESLCKNKATLESAIHKAIENNLWIFGPEYSLFSSNQTLTTQLNDFLGKKYTGKKAKDRPDLILNENLDGKRLLIEFKKPTVSLGLKAYQQSIGYRHEFTRISQSPMNIIVLGGLFGSDLPLADKREADVRFLTYLDVISSARKQLDWLLHRQLTQAI